MRISMLCLLVAAAAAAQPRFTEKDELMLPAGYHGWMLVGSSLGMSYNEASERPAREEFHNVYLHPDAFAAYCDTGEFPEGTILMMEVYSAGARESINRQGRFADDFLRVEAAVKDGARFEEGWAYFDFGGPTGNVREKAEAFPKKRCWACHNEHGGTDNVFTQFYGVLRRASQ